MDPQDTAGFEQTLVRLTQSERSLSQTRAKLVNAEAQAQELQGKVSGLTDELRELRELSQSLSRDSAAGTDECAKLAESLHLAEARAAEAEARAFELETRLAEAEAREREALIAAEDARDERLAALAELEQLRQGRSENSDTARKLAAAEARIDTLTHERVRHLELLSSLEVLGREITQPPPKHPACPGSKSGWGVTWRPSTCALPCAPRPFPHRRPKPLARGRRPRS
jgi:chromosome segregation ATPase